MSFLLTVLILFILGIIVGLAIIMKCLIRKNDNYLLSGMLITIICSISTLVVGSDYMRINNIKIFNPIIEYSGTYEIISVNKGFLTLKDENDLCMVIKLSPEQAQLYSEEDVINCSFRKRLKETSVDNFEAEVLEK